MHLDPATATIVLNEIRENLANGYTPEAIQAYLMENFNIPPLMHCPGARHGYPDCFCAEGCFYGLIGESIEIS